MKVRSSMLALLLATLALAPAGLAATRTTTVKVTAMDFSFKLSTKSVKAGKVTFSIHYSGKTIHDFEIAGHKSKRIGAGKATTLTVTLKKRRYPYKCTVYSHAKLGKKGVLRVT